MSGILLQFERNDLRIDRDITEELENLEFISEFYEWRNGKLECYQYDTEHGDSNYVEADLEELRKLGVRGWLEMRSPDYNEQWRYDLTDEAVVETGQMLVDKEVYYKLLNNLERIKGILRAH